MRICGVEIPEQLLQAQRTGKLALFVGAGVSMGRPSDLPSFKGLTELIASGSTLERQPDEPLERFLGRLHKTGVMVHQLAADRILQPTSKATSLHYDLLRLFPGEAAMRIITTNFDPHFDTAARTLFDQPIETFFAPALPMGSDFSGLVYVHGTATRTPLRFVLTDEDFGKAYLTQGWARRFVLELFSSFDVLFVGYSHNDAVMQYLARGLPIDGPNKRFALIAQDDDVERWRFLGVEPIAYPMPVENDHSQLSALIAEWAVLSNEGALGAELRIKGYTDGLPPVDEETQSYLHWAVKDKEAVRYFTRHAKHFEYVDWLDSRGLLEPLFAPGILDEPQIELAKWIANRFLLNDSEAIWLYHARFKSQINPIFAKVIAYELAFNNSISTDVFSRWITVLLDTPQIHSSHFDDLLLTSTERDALSATVSLFLYLTGTRLEIKKRLSLFEDPDEGDRQQSKVSMDIEFKGDHWHLNEAWTNYLSSRIEVIGDAVWPTLAAHLNKAHTLSLIWGSANQDWDSLSWRRSAIEPHEQDDHQDVVDVLINALRDILEWKITNSQDFGRAVIDSLAAASAPILKRIAFHGLRLSAAWTPDEKIDWLLSKDSFLRLKHETFLLLKETYPLSSHGRRNAVLGRIDQLQEQYPDCEEELLDYERFNILSWLLGVIPTDEEILSRIDAIKDRYPDQQFQVREYPDLDHWMSSGWVADKEQPSDEASLRDLAFDEVLQLLQTELASKTDRWHRTPTEKRITSEVTTQPEWGVDLATKLTSDDAWVSDAWGALIIGWEAAELTPEQWHQVLRVLMQSSAIVHSQQTLADLLSRGAEKATTGIPSVEFPLADEIALDLWNNLPRPGQVETEDWLQSSLNRPAGKLARFWLEMLSRYRSENAVENRRTIPLNLRERFEMILTDDSDQGRLGVTMLASQLTFLYSADPDWTRMHLLPLFAWDRTPSVALQAWNGFLIWGNWYPALFSELYEVYRAAFGHVQAELAGFRDRFAEHVALISLFGSANPLDKGWLAAYLERVELTDRIAFARHLGHHLRDQEDTRRIASWDRWIKNYWQERLHGRPLPLDEGETQEMLDWVVLLTGKAFIEAIDLLEQCTLHSFDDTRLLYHLKKSPLLADEPDAVARLIAFLTGVANVPRYRLDDLAQILATLIGRASNREVLLRGCEKLGRLGGERALSLKEAIDNAYPPQ